MPNYVDIMNKTFILAPTIYKLGLNRIEGLYYSAKNEELKLVFGQI